MIFAEANKLHDINNWHDLGIGLFRYRLNDHTVLELIVHKSPNVSDQNSIYFEKSDLFKIDQVTNDFKRSPFPDWNTNCNNVFENLHRAAMLALKIEED